MTITRGHVSPYIVGAHRTLLARTCIKCGELKQGSEFSFFFNRKPRCKTSTLTRASWCIRCNQKFSTARTIKSNHDSWDKAVNHHQRWTDEEFDWLYVLHGVEYPWVIIAETLGRSIAAVQDAYHKRFVKEVD